MLRKTLRKAYVLIYNQGQDQEGVYTLYAEVSMETAGYVIAQIYRNCFVVAC